MCGIVGFWSPNIEHQLRVKTLASMSACLRHRGPDSDGAWFDTDAGIALGHRRLSIVDLSPTGAQPMHSRSGRWVVILNGEIYNYRTLRHELHALGHSFVGSSDTEVFLAAVEQWGVTSAVERSAGMFAIALWDRRERRLALARDRMGEKPLYVASMNGSLMFASELKAFRSHPHWRGVVDRAALAEFLRFTYVPTDSAIYSGVTKVAPGTIVTYDFGLESSDRAGHVERYWNVADVMVKGAANRLLDTSASLVDELDAVLRNTVSEQMVADVPLGAFLSGGVDSSLVVALMQQLSPGRVRTFSIGFDVEDYNEAHHAKAVAAHLGTEHTEYYVSAKEAMGVIERLPAIYDEPFADSSQIPTFLVSKLARTAVTVSLSGDGGDEVFGGYNRYAWMERIWGQVDTFPLWLRRGAGRLMTEVPPRAWDRVGQLAGTITPRLRFRTYGDKVHKLATLLQLQSREALYERIISAWTEPDRVIVGAGTRHEPRAVADWPPGALTFTEQMMLADMLGYLPGDILVKVDRAAMAVSLETRAPFIDHRVIEFAARLPFAAKVRGGTSKWILRELLDRYVPRSLIERPKMGFGVPVHAWLRTELRDWAEALLDPRRLRHDGFFEAGVVSDVWQAHLDGRVNAMPQLWPILMFQAWLDDQQTQRLEQSAA
ncbi:MAG: asparagine synthase (glutamine-hydrolyzing) [bacterium]